MDEYKDGQNDRRPKKRKNLPNMSGKSIYDKVIFHMVDNSFINKSKELLLLRCYWN